MNQAREELGQELVNKPVPDWQVYWDKLGVRPTCQVCGAPLLDLAPVFMLPANDNQL